MKLIFLKPVKCINGEYNAVMIINSNGTIFTLQATQNLSLLISLFNLIK